MKKLLALLLALLLLTGCAAKAPAGEAPPAEEPAEETTEETTGEASAYLGDFSARTLTGDTLDQTFFANADLTVINVWATYCGPCKQEMPILGALDQELENVQILGIVTDVIDQNGEPNESQVELFLSEHKRYHTVPINKYLPEGIYMDEEREEAAANGMITLLPHVDKCEGFFICRMERDRKED